MDRGVVDDFFAQYKGECHELTRIIMHLQNIECAHRDLHQIRDRVFRGTDTQEQLRGMIRFNDTQLYIFDQRRQLRVANESTPWTTEQYEIRSDRRPQDSPSARLPPMAPTAPTAAGAPAQPVVDVVVDINL